MITTTEYLREKARADAAELRVAELELQLGINVTEVTDDDTQQGPDLPE